MGWFDELLGNCVVQKLQQAVEIAADVEQPARLLMKTKQPPAHHLGKTRHHGRGQPWQKSETGYRGTF